MKLSNVLNKQTTRNILFTVCAIALALASVAALPKSARADDIIVPTVPENLKIDEGNKVFLVGHATGTQNYICLPSSTSPSGFAYSLFTPEATLFDDENEQIITHFFSVNPDPADNGAIRATWEDSRDTSMVWAALVPGGSAKVTDGAVDWLKLKVVGHKDGPTGGDRLSSTTFIQRLNTTGGLAPLDCASSADVGKRAFVPYTADYFFYKKSGK